MNEVIDNKKDNKVPVILVTLKRLDVMRLHARDAAVLYYVFRNPGANRKEIAAALGLNAEVNVRLPVQRLVRMGLIEDRRPSHARLVSSLLHVTDAGVKAWEDLVR